MLLPHGTFEALERKKKKKERIIKFDYPGNWSINKIERQFNLLLRFSFCFISSSKDLFKSPSVSSSLYHWYMGRIPSSMYYLLLPIERTSEVKWQYSANQWLIYFSRKKNSFFQLPKKRLLIHTRTDNSKKKKKRDEIFAFLKIKHDIWGFFFVWLGIENKIKHNTTYQQNKPRERERLLLWNITQQISDMNRGRRGWRKKWVCFTWEYNFVFHYVVLHLDYDHLSMMKIYYLHYSFHYHHSCFFDLYDLYVYVLSAKTITRLMIDLKQGHISYIFTNFSYESVESFFDTLSSFGRRLYEGHR